MLFDEDGGLLADFGLARALAEAASTEPSGTLLGTAPRPRRARGEPVGERATSYSLVLTMTEAVTGEVLPFSLDTALGTLAARWTPRLRFPTSSGHCSGRSPRPAAWIQWSGPARPNWS